MAHALPRSLRRGSIATRVIVGLVVVGVIAGAGWYLSQKKAAAIGVGPLVKNASVGPYELVVLEQGEVESASNVELRCEVKSRSGGSGGGITILEVVPEGTMVKGGEVLVRLDSSSLEQDRIQQQIACNSGESLVVQAKNTLDAAKIARKEYLEGTFRQEERTIQGEVFVAEQNLRSAQLAYDSAERLAAKNIISSLQLEGARFSVDKAQNELDAANGKLDVLRRYTKEKMLKQFDSDIATAEAKVKSEESSYNLELQKLHEIEQQIAKCILVAPQAGQVVYANKFNSSGRGGSTAEFVVEAGALVREQQPIVRLPDAANMQVKALVNEARVTMVRVGMPVAIRVDALKDEMIQGEVIKVNQYAEPGGWSSGNVKKYAAIVRILNPPPALRSGMNAEVRIFIERLDNALQIPIQALVEHKGHYFCVVKRSEKFETLEVSVTSTNDKVAVITPAAGHELKDKDEVAMSPRSTIGLLQFPADLKEVTPASMVPGKASPAVRPAGLPGSTEGAAAGGNVAKGPPGGGPPGGGAPEGGRPKGPPSPKDATERLFASADTNTDNKITPEELDAYQSPYKPKMEDFDQNKDGAISREEALIAISKRMRERQANGGGGPGGPGGSGAPGAGANP